jgi:hypothetical protein
MSHFAISRESSESSDSILSERLLKRLLFILVVFQATALLAITDWVVATWGKEEWVVLWIPQSILQWSLIGAIAGALYRLSSYPRLSEQEKATLYLWILAKPFVSTAFGCVVYLLAIGGVLMLFKGNSARTNMEMLAAVSFFAAFSDRFALSVLDRLLFPPSATDAPRVTSSASDARRSS